jgi:hypothetical protein
MAETGPPTFKLVLVGDGGTGKVSKALREGCLGPLRRWRSKGFMQDPQQPWAMGEHILRAQSLVLRSAKLIPAFSLDHVR